MTILFNVQNIYICKNVKLGSVALIIWAFITILLILKLIVSEFKLRNILLLVPDVENKELIHELIIVCKKEKLRKIPKVIQLDMSSGPFISGFKNPIIVFPMDISGQECNLILMHEVNHIKFKHIYIKMFVEFITAIYWWNPFIWFLRFSLLRAMEMYTDVRVLTKLPPSLKWSYLELLISIAKRVHQTQGLSLSLAIDRQMVGCRVRTALDNNCFKDELRLLKKQILAFIIVIILFMFSLFYIFEPYQVDQAKVEGTFEIKKDSDNDYFVKRENSMYDLYINNDFVVTLTRIPDDLLHLSVIK